MGSRASFSLAQAFTPGNADGSPILILPLEGAWIRGVAPFHGGSTKGSPLKGAIGRFSAAVNPGVNAWARAPNVRVGRVSGRARLPPSRALRLGGSLALPAVRYATVRRSREGESARNSMIQRLFSKKIRASLRGNEGRGWCHGLSSTRARDSTARARGFGEPVAPEGENPGRAPAFSRQERRGASKTAFPRGPWDRGGWGVGGLESRVTKRTHRILGEMRKEERKGKRAEGVERADGKRGSGRRGLHEVRLDRPSAVLPFLHRLSVHLYTRSAVLPLSGAADAGLMWRERHTNLLDATAP